MKKVYFLVLFFVIATRVHGQKSAIDTLRVTLRYTSADTDRMKTLSQLSYAYFLSNPDSSLLFAQESYDLAVKHGKIPGIAKALNLMANAYSTVGDYAKAMQFYFNAIRTYETLNDVPDIVREYSNIGATYTQALDYKNALRYLQQANSLWTTFKLSHTLGTADQKQEQTVLDINIAECYLYTHKIDLADRYLRESIDEEKNSKVPDLTENIDRDLGEVEIERGNKALALKYLKEGISLSSAAKDIEMLSISYLSTARLYNKYGQQDSAEYYAKKALDVATAGKYQQDALNAAIALNRYYDDGKNLPLAYKYFKLATAARDSLYSQEKLKQLLSVDFEEKQRRQEIAAAQVQYREKVRLWALIAGIAVLLLLVLLFWRNARHRKHANVLLQEQKEEIESALEQLQVTQKQLVQSEKMASLGELTAGIAHEIQNPLNFVNNFSEVNIELISEMQTELETGTKEEVIDILEDIKQNLEKISHHGKRADSIVKGMLQHSRASSNVKEPTDLNLLADEYLRLAYHGLRAKDKSFNADLVTKFDESLPKVNIVPQDIGRVLVNLFTNAFYAVRKKQAIAGKGYKPTVEVKTSVPPLGGRGAMLIIRDNGTGISDEIKDKIMQPFFTTKPAGEGTGLGLSMSYEIIVKEHGGNIDVVSKENEYTEFTLTLPL